MTFDANKFDRTDLGTGKATEEQLGGITMDGQSVRYNAIKLRHTNLEPTNLLLVSECALSLADDGPALFCGVERVKEVWENAGGDLADFEDGGTHEIVEVIVTTIQRPYDISRW